ncbi:MAG: histidine kinase [Pseudomonas sp.]|uniref:sensor histidine kinase n=1 Tax=Ectopseudomonas guguanensis TaxID=1198456 RepID=UPI0012D65F72|nr:MULTISPECIES: sensor histidine kinase [Pseudomonas]MPT16602.1 histidine kinase [Pseudomonas sp.]WJH56712.1 histidine kinase [Pseudomonas guguanensis]
MDASESPLASQLQHLYAALALLCLLICATARAYGSELEQRFEHRRWTHNDDSPSQIGALAQTRDGYLWLGTHDSLYRFDGLDFTRYLAADGQELGIVSTLLASDQGLWVGLRNGGVRLIDNEGEMAAAFDLGRGTIYALAQTVDGQLWAAANDGLMRFDGQSWQQLSSEAGFVGKNAYALLVDTSGRLWVADEQRLYTLEPGARMLRDSGIAVRRPRQIVQAPDGALWLAERDGESVLRLDSSTGQAIRIEVGESVNALLFDQRGALWLSTAGHGLLHAAQPNRHEAGGFGTLEGFSARDGLSSDLVAPLHQDSEGSLWVGTHDGLDRLRDRPLHPAGLPANAQNLALVADQAGTLWAGSSNLPVMRLDRDGLQYLPLQTPISATARDSQGNAWLAGPQGIWRSEGASLQKVAELPVQRSLDSAVRAMLVDRQGELWLSVNRQGLFVLRDGRWHGLPPPSAEPAQQMPVSAALAPDGGRWFGYRDNLLVSHDDGGERHWGAAEGLDVGHVTAMAHLPGHAWVGGQRGLARFDGQRFRRLPLPDNGLFDNLYAIVPVQVEAGEDLWLQGKGGIFQLPAAEIAQALENPAHHIRYRTYAAQGGLANDPHQVLPLPTAVRVGDDQLWFVTRNGVVGLDPRRTQQASAPPRVRIESLIVDGAPLPTSTSPVLPSSSQRLIIHYGALSLSAPEGLHFLYRLDGFDHTWHSAGRQRQAVYTDLPAGDYRFRVRALNQSGVPSERDAELDFSIGPVFYRQPWFLLSLGIALLGALHLIYRSNMRRAAEHLRTRLEERHEERERIARELHDTLLQGVQGLMLHVQAAADSLPAEQPSRGLLEKALDRADQVINEGRERVRDLRNVRQASADLPKALRELEHLLDHPGVAYRVEVKGTPLALHPVVHDELYLLAREAVGNAFRHAHASLVQVQLDYDPRQFELLVTDDGRGIRADQLDSSKALDHWGLQGMHERAAKMSATLDIHGVHGSGSQVHLTLAGELAYRCEEPPARRRLHWKRFTRSPRP